MSSSSSSSSSSSTHPSQSPQPTIISTTLPYTFAPSSSFLNLRKCFEFSLNAMDTIPPCKTFLSTPTTKRGYVKLIQPNPVIYLNQMKLRLSKKSYEHSDQYGLEHKDNNNTINPIVYKNALYWFLQDIFYLQQNTKIYYDFIIYNKKKDEFNQEVLQCHTGIGKRHGSSSFAMLSSTTTSTTMQSSLGSGSGECGNGETSSPIRMTRSAIPITTSSIVSSSSSSSSSSTSSTSTSSSFKPIFTYASISPNDVDIHITHVEHHGCKIQDCLLFHYDVDIVAMMLQTHLKLWIHLFLYLSQPLIYQPLLIFYRHHYQIQFNHSQRHEERIDLTPPILPASWIVLLQQHTQHLPSSLQAFYTDIDILNYLFQPSCIIDKTIIHHLTNKELHKVYQSLMKAQDKMINITQQYQLQLQSQLFTQYQHYQHSILPYTTSSSSILPSFLNKPPIVEDILPLHLIHDIFSLLIVEEDFSSLYTLLYNTPNKSMVEKLWNHEQIWLVPKAGSNGNHVPARQVSNRGRFATQAAGSSSEAVEEEKESSSSTRYPPQQHGQDSHRPQIKASRRYKSTHEPSSSEDEPFQHSYITSSSEEDVVSMEEDEEDEEHSVHQNESKESEDNKGIVKLKQQSSKEPIIINLVNISQMSYAIDPTPLTIPVSLPSPSQLLAPTPSPMITLKSHKFPYRDTVEEIPKKPMLLESEHPSGPTMQAEEVKSEAEEEKAITPTVASEIETSPLQVLQSKKKPVELHDRNDGWMEEKNTNNTLESDTWGKLFPSLKLNPNATNSTKKRAYGQTHSEEVVVDLCSSDQISSVEESGASSFLHTTMATENEILRKRHQKLSESVEEPDSLEDVYVPLKSAIASKSNSGSKPKSAGKNDKQSRSPLLSPKKAASTPSPKKAKREDLLTKHKHQSPISLLLSSQRTDIALQLPNEDIPGITVLPTSQTSASSNGTLSQNDRLIPTNLPALLEVEKEMKENKPSSCDDTSDLHIRYSKVMATLAKSIPFVYQHSETGKKTQQELCCILKQLETCCEQLDVLQQS